MLLRCPLGLDAHDYIVQSATTLFLPANDY
jgi:hypothetical protein